MAEFVKGDIVVVPFPFSDLSQAKKRPALVISVLEGDDVILCQITSQSVRDDYAILINDIDFNEGSLRNPSNVRPNRLFTSDRNIILYKLGKLKTSKLAEIIEKIVTIIRN